MSVFTNAASGGQEQAREYTRAVLDLVGERDPLVLLDSTPSEARRAIRGLDREQLRAPEAPGKWSVQHVLQHLADSDLVWGNRLRLVLAHERPVLTGYDQDLWASRLRYDESDPESWSTKERPGVSRAAQIGAPPGGDDQFVAGRASSARLMPVRLPSPVPSFCFCEPSIRAL
ncbi:MAG: DinB family protein [Gemmatimonadota bacterium]